MRNIYNFLFMGILYFFMPYQNSIAGATIVLGVDLNDDYASSVLKEISKHWQAPSYDIKGDVSIQIKIDGSGNLQECRAVSSVDSTQIDKDICKVARSIGKYASPPYAIPVDVYINVKKIKTNIANNSASNSVGAYLLQSGAVTAKDVKTTNTTSANKANEDWGDLEQSLNEDMSSTNKAKGNIVVANPDVNSRDNVSSRDINDETIIVSNEDIRAIHGAESNMYVVNPYINPYINPDTNPDTNPDINPDTNPDTNIDSRANTSRAVAGGDEVNGGFANQALSEDGNTSSNKAIGKDIAIESNNSTPESNNLAMAILPSQRTSSQRELNQRALNSDSADISHTLIGENPNVIPEHAAAMDTVSNEDWGDLEQSLNKDINGMKVVEKNMLVANADTRVSTNGDTANGIWATNGMGQQALVEGGVTSSELPNQRELSQRELAYETMAKSSADVNTNSTVVDKNDGLMDINSGIIGENKTTHKSENIDISQSNQEKSISNTDKLYTQAVMKKIAPHVRLPENLNNGKYTIEMHLDINAKGVVEQVNIKNSAGIQNIDKVIVSAIKEIDDMPIPVDNKPKKLKLVFIVEKK